LDLLNAKDIENGGVYRLPDDFQQRLLVSIWQGVEPVGEAFQFGVGPPPRRMCQCLRHGLDRGIVNSHLDAFDEIILVHSIISQTQRVK